MIRLLDVPPVISNLHELRIIKHIVSFADATSAEDAITDLRCAILHYQEKLEQRKLSHDHERYSQRQDVNNEKD